MTSVMLKFGNYLINTMLMITYILFFLPFFLQKKIYGNYIVSFLKDNDSDFQKMKNNIGYLHSFSEQNKFIVIYNQSLNKTYLGQMQYWKNVNLLEFETIFIGRKYSDEISDSIKIKYGVLKFLFENLLILDKSKIFLFKNDIDISCINPNLSEILMSKTSYSDSHISIDKQSYLKLNVNFSMMNFESLYQNLSLIKIYQKNCENKEHSCFIKFKDRHLEPLYFEEISNEHNQIDNLAIMIPTIHKSKILEECIFFNITLKSIKNSLLERELNNFKITFYFAVDKNDILAIDEYFKINHKTKILDQFDNSKKIDVKYFIYDRSESVVFLWNALFTQAFKDNNDLFLQLNDDTTIQKPGWLSEVKKIFDSGFDGVIGFNAIEWNCKIFTQSIVSRHHFTNTGGNFYPTDFQNAMSDIWMTEFYAHNRICLKDFQTFNHFSKTRYKKCPFNKGLLKSLLKSFDYKQWNSNLKKK